MYDSDTTVAEAPALGAARGSQGVSSSGEESGRRAEGLGKTLAPRETARAFLDFDRLLDDPDVTDIRIQHGYGLYYRRFGIVHSMPCDFGDIVNLRSEFLEHVGLPHYENDSVAATYRGHRLRIELGTVMMGQDRKVWVRRLDPEIPTLENMGYVDFVKPAMQQVMDKSRNGLIVVAGPTSSGKTTLLASLLQYILDHNPAHVCTIEDPIEYVLKPGIGEISQHQVPADIRDPAQGLVTILRKDPNVVLVGELRDEYFASTAVDAAETGHLTLATVHASDTVGVLQRLESLTKGNQMFKTRLSSVLFGIIVLRLKYLTDEEGNSHSGRECERLWIRDHPRRMDIMQYIAEGTRESYNRIAEMAEISFVRSLASKEKFRSKDRSEYSSEFQDLDVL